MLEQIEYRRKSAGASVCALASELGVSHTLLSLTLNRQRKVSKPLQGRFKEWLRTPLTVDPPNAPSTVYGRFIDEKRAQLAPLTVKFYQAKLGPFVVWCEQQKIVDVHHIERQHESKPNTLMCSQRVYMPTVFATQRSPDCYGPKCRFDRFRYTQGIPIRKLL